MTRPAPLLVAVWTCLGVACSSPGIDLERMREQPRADPYGSSPVFANGAAMRVPPAGTIEYEARPTAAAIHTGRRAGEPVRELPLPITPELLAVGQNRYRTFCVVCHGPDGAGHAIMAANMPDQRLSLLTAEAAALTPGEVFELIAHGRNRMPSFDWALSAEDRWAVVVHVQQLERSPAAAQKEAQKERGR